MMRIGIVGFGKMGMLHGALLNSIGGVEITAIADTSRMVLRAFKSVLPDIKYFASYETMLDECSLDAVIICTPSFSHTQIAKYAASRNVNIFIEKPMSSSLEQAIHLYELLKEKPLISMIGFSSRYIPTFLKGKEIIESGILGRIESVKAQAYIADVFSKQRGWRYNKSFSGGGVLIDVGVHMIDLLYWYFGKIASVIGSIKSIYSDDVEDEAAVHLNFKNGLGVDFDCSWSKVGYRKLYLKMEIEGEKGEIIITDQNLTRKMHKPNDAESETLNLNYADLYEGYYIDLGEPQYSIQMKRFTDNIKKKRKSDVDVEAGLYVQKIIDGIYASARRKREILLNGEEFNGK
jgi:UDP-N-acetyl-2-amino-2-deoxyglucuronate dehydrogenase